MPLPSYTNGRNGHGPGENGAPSAQDGAFHIPGILEAPANLVRPSRPRTVFPAEPSADSLRALLYNAYRHEVGAVRLTRWLIFFCLLIAAVWATGFLPGRWWVSGGALLAALVLVTAVVSQRRRDFVRFEELSRPEVTPAKIDPNDKIGVHVTGHFSVEGQYARYTYLPGFYRTFATREHALLCLVRSRRFLKIATWPPEQTGMWYIFFTPQLMYSVRYGRLHFSSTVSPAIAVDYDLTVLKPGRTKEQIVRETVYIACANETDAVRMLADLLVDIPLPVESPVRVQA